MTENLENRISKKEIAKLTFIPGYCILSDQRHKRKMETEGIKFVGGPGISPAPILEAYKLIVYGVIAYAVYDTIRNIIS